MYFHVQRLITDIEQNEPDPAAANALQEGLGGQSGEMRTMMQYPFQTMNFRTDLSAIEQAPEGVPSTIAPERFEEFSPGLDPELLKLIQTTAEMELDEITSFYGPTAK